MVLLYQANSASSLYLALSLHTITSLLGTTLLVTKLSFHQYKRQRYAFYALLMQFAFFLPIVGLLTAFVLAYHHIFINHQEEQEQSIDNLLFSPESETLDLPLGESKQFRQLLRHQNPDSYLQLILSTRYMDERNAVRILKFALNTDIENVRLLAQARLDSKENAINQALEQHIALSQTHEHRKNIHLYLEIAQQYWNLANLGLAKDAVLEHVLKQLQKYTRIVQLIQPNESKSYYLSAKGFLLSRNLTQAKQQFRLAFKTGMPKSKILPALQEITFYEKGQATKVRSTAMNQPLSAETVQ
jgi:hypothetical protein